MEARKLDQLPGLASLLDALIQQRVEQIQLGQRVNLDGLLLCYLDALRGEGRRPRYVRDVEGSLRHALGFLAVRRIDEIDCGALLRYRSALLSSGVSIRTAEKKVSAVCSWLRWLDATGTAPLTAPKIRVRRAREDQLRHDRRSLSYEELDAYLAAHAELDRRDGGRSIPQLPLYLTLAVTGCRWGEVASASWEHVDWESPRLRVSAQSSKSRRNRWVPLTAQAIGQLERVRRGSAQEPIFRGVRSKGPIRHRPALRRHDEALRLAGIPRRDSSGRVVDLHALRVSAITGWLEAGLSLSEVQALAGHTDIRVTAGYARHSPSEVLRRATDAGRHFHTLDQAATDCAALPFDGPL